MTAPSPSLKGVGARLPGWNRSPPAAIPSALSGAWPRWWKCTSWTSPRSKPPATA